MRILDSGIYQADLDQVCSLDLPWAELNGKRILISGATGMIGSTLIDVLMKKNGCRIIALGRNEEKARERFREYWDSPLFCFARCDINSRESLEKACAEIPSVDYVFHAASNTHPVAYANDPIGTVVTNIIGLDNLLNFASEHGCGRFLFASSNEIYGENRGDEEFFREESCGYIDCNTLRAGYPESKRCGEALCQAYRKQKGMDIVIPRLTRSYGPTFLETDTKAISQFIKKGVQGEDIILKSAGTQFYSYTYVADAVSGLLTVLLKGEDGEAYNIADESSDITLRDLAELIAGISGKEVRFEIPDAVEAAGYSKATKARLDGHKLQALGWQPQYDIRAGIERTIAILMNCRKI